MFSPLGLDMIAFDLVTDDVKKTGWLSTNTTPHVQNRRVKQVKRYWGEKRKAGKKDFPFRTRSKGIYTHNTPGLSRTEIWEVRHYEDPLPCKCDSLLDKAQSSLRGNPSFLLLGLISVFFEVLHLRYLPWSHLQDMEVCTPVWLHSWVSLL